MAEFRTDNLARELVPGVEALLQARIAEATEEVVSKATKEFEQRLRRSIATAALDIASFFDVQRDGANVVITVRDLRKGT